MLFASQAILGAGPPKPHREGFGRVFAADLAADLLTGVPPLQFLSLKRVSLFQV